MTHLKLMVDKALDDGRLVVINCSGEDIPLGTVFGEMTMEASKLVAGKFNTEPIGSTQVVALRLETVESWRKSLEAVPYGHNAAVHLSGPGLVELVHLLSGKSKGEYVYLATDGDDTGRPDGYAQPMKIGPRYLHKRCSFPDGAAEKAALLVSLESAPGLISIGNIEPHHKGGHRTSLEIDRASLDDFIGHMDSEGWMDGL